MNNRQHNNNKEHIEFINLLTNMIRDKRVVYRRHAVRGSYIDFIYTDLKEEEILTNGFRRLIDKYDFMLNAHPFEDDKINPVKAYNINDKYWSQFLRTYLFKTDPLPIKGDLVAKTIRADENSYFRSFVEGIVEPNVKRPVRRVGKKEFTVIGGYVLDRKTKQPQFTPEQKKGYSNPQPSTYIVTDSGHRPSLFNFGDPINPMKVGILNSTKNILLSNRLMVKDKGSVRRFYDFHTREQAEEFLASSRNQLFNANEIEKFKSIILRPENRKYYNEAIVRLKWNPDGSSIIFISEDYDVIEARLMAQDYARIIKMYLLRNRMISPDAQIPIVFYPSFMTYTVPHQELDKAIAVETIYRSMSDDAITKFKDFVYYLAVDDIKRLIQMIFVDSPMFDLMLVNGYTHIAQSLLEKMIEQNVNWQQVIDSYKLGSASSWVGLLEAYKNGADILIPIIHRRHKDKKRGLLWCVEPDTILVYILQTIYNGHLHTLFMFLSDLEPDWKKIVDRNKNNFLHLYMKSPSQEFVTELFKLPILVKYAFEKNNADQTPMSLFLNKYKYHTLLPDKLFMLPEARPAMMHGACCTKDLKIIQYFIKSFVTCPEDINYLSELSKEFKQSQELNALFKFYIRRSELILMLHHHLIQVDNKNRMQNKNKLFENSNSLQNDAIEVEATKHLIMKLECHHGQYSNPNQPPIVTPLGFMNYIEKNNFLMGVYLDCMNFGVKFLSTQALNDKDAVKYNAKIRSRL